MILSETVFIKGQPIGVIRKDTNTRQIAFSATRPPSLLPAREWSSIDEIKAAVKAAYENGEGSPDEEPGQTNRAQA